MEFALLGWADAAPTLRLDYRRFSYAGKFVTGGTGVAVIRGKPDDSATKIDDANAGNSSTDAETDPKSVAPLPDGVAESDFVDNILAAIAFSPDRTDRSTLKIRYLTVRDDLRGDGQQLGPRLVVFLTSKAATAGYDRIAIAVNNAFSYHALYKAGFSYTDRETGLAELMLDRPIDKSAVASQSGYQRGLDVFREREGLSTAETEFLAAYDDAEPPALLPAVDDR
jgi:hypothetical protein